MGRSPPPPGPWAELGFLLGLGAALSWGLADVVAARATRRIGTVRIVLGFHAVACALLVALALATGALRHVGVGDLWFFAGVGALGWGSYVAFYGALRIGPISIVSPIVSSYAAVTVVLAIAVLGERPSGVQLLAIGLSFAGIALVSLDLRGSEHPTRAATRGIALALLTALLIGSFVFGVSYHESRLGWLAPIVLARSFSLLFLLGQARLLGTGGPPAGLAEVRRLAVVAPVALLALLDTGGYASFNVGVGHGETAVVAAASAPYALVPVVGGVLLLRERPAPSQWTGIAVLLAGLVLLGIVSP